MGGSRSICTEPRKGKYPVLPSAERTPTLYYDRSQAHVVFFFAPIIEIFIVVLRISTHISIVHNSHIHTKNLKNHVEVVILLLTAFPVTF